MKGIKVAKFGGTSLADAEQIKKVIDIVRADPRRRYIVVSAPGKRHGTDEKLTDLLYGFYRAIDEFSAKQIFEIIASRFRGIVQELGIDFFDLNFQLDIIQKTSRLGQASSDFLVSRGEYVMAMILAEALEYTFVDAADFIQLTAFGRLDMEATEQCRTRLEKEAKGFVIPGFYGSMPTGHIKTFTRGGSDLTGAVVSHLVGAELYENWTDVSGLLMADPQVIPAAKKIDIVTYKELRELTYMGARVLHDEVIFPLKKSSIPIRICNTNHPNESGTMIVPDSEAPLRRAGSIVGVAGRKDFTVITVEKTLMNQEVGFVRQICNVFEDLDVNIEHIPGGIDTLSVVVASESLNGKLDRLIGKIVEVCRPDAINVNPRMALICTVGHAMAHSPGVAARLFQALYNEKVNVRMIDQGSSELSIIIGVENDDYETAVRAIYHTFVD